MSPFAIHDRLTWAEVSSQYAIDCRRIISAERQSLGLALKSGDATRIAAATKEALRVADMWGVELWSPMPGSGG